MFLFKLLLDYILKWLFELKDNLSSTICYFEIYSFNNFYKEKKLICNNIHDFIHCISEGRILGLDIGLKNIGIALTDVSKLIANPYNVLSRKTFKQDLSILNNIIIEYKICGIVAGLPKQMNGIEGASCTMVKNFIEKLDQYLSVPIFLQDERLTTTAALRILKESGISRKKQEKLDDKIAASYILQTVLDQMRFINGT